MGVVFVEGGGHFWGEFGASHCNQWVLCCTVVCEPIELLFQVVSVVGPGIGVLDGGRRAAREGVLGSFLPIGLNGALLSRNVLDLCVKS